MIADQRRGRNEANTVKEDARLIGDMLIFSYLDEILDEEI